MITIDDFGVEMETVEEPDYAEIPETYERLKLSDMADEETITGKPYLTKVNAMEFDNNEILQVTLTVIDDINEEALIANFKVNEKSDVQHNVHHKSKLFKFVKSLMLACGVEKEGNQMKTIDLNKVRSLVCRLSSMTVEAETTSFPDKETGDEISYNNLNVLNVKE